MATATLTLALTGVAFSAKPTTIRSGNLIVDINGGVTPKKLPRHRPAPIKLSVAANIRTADGGQPPVAKTVTIDFDRHGSISASGLASCRAGRLESRTTKQAKKVCPRAIVGGGRTSVRVAFPESRPFTASGPLVAFNGGTRGKVTTMLIHAYVSVPAPTAIVTTVKITRISKGRFGTRAIAKIPTIANGAGALTKFNLNVKRSFRKHGRKHGYLVARCANGRFFAHATVAFDDGSKLAGLVVRPCTPRG